MALDYTYFKIALTPKEGKAPSDGFLDSNTPQNYITYEGTTDFLGTGWPSTNEKAMAKARANLRWITLLQTITLQVTPIDLKVTKNEGGSSDAPPSAFEFVLIVDRPEAFNMEDTQNPGKFLTGVSAVKRLVANVLTSHIQKNGIVYLPEIGTANKVSGQPASPVHYGESVQTIIAGPVAEDISSAEALISVSIIEGTEQKGVVNPPEEPKPTGTNESKDQTEEKTTETDGKSDDKGTEPTNEKQTGIETKTDSTDGTKTETTETTDGKTDSNESKSEPAETKTATTRDQTGTAKDDKGQADSSIENKFPSTPKATA